MRSRRKKSRIRRSDALRKLCAHLGLRWLDEDQHGLAPYLKDFYIMQSGNSKIYNVIYMPTHDAECYIFDHKYHDYNSDRVERQTIFFIHSKFLGLPDFHLYPEHIGHRFADWLGLSRDIDFSDYEQFSKQYRLKGKDEPYIRYHFKESILDYFTREAGWSLEGVNYYMLYYRRHKLVRVDTIRSFIQQGMYLFDQFSHVDDGVID